MDKIKIAVLGGSGYTAVELLKILLRHPHVEIAAVTRSARLHKHRMALRRTRQIQRPLHLEKAAIMIDGMHLLHVDEASARLVANKSVIVPAVPECLDELRELCRARIALRVIWYRVVTKVARRR